MVREVGVALVMMDRMDLDVDGTKILGKLRYMLYTFCAFSENPITFSQSVTFIPKLDFLLLTNDI